MKVLIACEEWPPLQQADLLVAERVAKTLPNANRYQS